MSISNTIPLGKNLFILYLIISSNFLPNLFGCKVQYELQHNMPLKHFLGFLTLYFFITLVDTSEQIPDSLSDRFKIAVVVYLWFLLSTKMDMCYWIPMILSLAGVYVIELNKEGEKKKPSATQDLKRLQQYQQVQVILIGFSLLVTLFGFFVYLGEKKLEYGDHFSYPSFLFGKPTCKGDLLVSKISSWEAIRQAFI